VLKDWQAAVGRLVLQARERWREGVLPNVLECGGSGMTLLALALLSILPRDDVARESVDLIEVNHFYSENAELVFDQIIFYEWSKGDARYMVRSWRLIKTPLQIPYRDHANGGYTAVWVDGGDVLRVIRSRDFRETWSQAGVGGDPELNEREFLPKDQRRELRPSRVLKR
jgi:hypothetical protein